MQNKNLEMSLEGPIIQAIFKLALPILLANLLQSAYQLTDAFWVGRLGGDAVASVSISFPITFLMISLGTGFAIAGSTLIAQYVGAKNREMVNHVAAQTLMMVAVVSVVLGAIGYVISPFLLDLMGVTPAVFENALSFMRIGFVGMIFIFSFSMFQSIMRGLGEVTMPLYIVLGTVFLNFALDPLFIFGYSIIPAMGVSGAAFATLLTQGIASIIGFVILLGGKYGIHLELKDFLPDYAYIKKAFFLGLPSSLEMSGRALAMVVMNFLIASFGTIAVASYGAGSTILQLVMIPAMGLAMATATLIGQNIGAKNITRASEIGKVSAYLSFGTLGIMGVLIYIFAPTLVSFFIPNDQVIIDGGAHFLRLTALGFGFIGIQFSINGILRAAGNMKTSLVISLISQWVIQFPIAYILSKHTNLGIDGIWYAFMITNVLTAIITVIWYIQGDWKNSSLTEDSKAQAKVFKETATEEVIR